MAKPETAAATRTPPSAPPAAAAEAVRDAPSGAAGLRVRAVLALASLVALGGSALALRSPAWIEAWYVPGPGAAAGQGLAAASRVSPFALPDLVVPLFILALLAPPLAAIARAARGRERWTLALGRAGLTVLALTLFAAATFQWAWGLHYGRPRIHERWGFPGQDEAIPGDGFAFAAQLTARVNGLYVAVTGTADLGRPTAPRLDAREVDHALERAYARLAERLGKPQLAAPRPTAKATRLSPILQRLGISGFYFPWTGEACYVAEVPWASRVQTIAHEKAHQRGVAREDEANFVGALACLAAEEPYLRYAGYFFLHRQALQEVAGLDPRFLAAIRSRNPGVQRDVDDVAAFWGRTEGSLRGVGQAVNDAYLKTHGTEGVAAYRKSASLVARFATTAEGNALLFPADERP